mgnify:CR=1 FL=1
MPSSASRPASIAWASSTSSSTDFWAASRGKDFEEQYREAVVSNYELFRKLVADFIRRGQDSGEFRSEVDAEALAATVVATVRTASWKAAASGASATVENLDATSSAAGHTRFVGMVVEGGERPDLQSAARVVSGGRAFGSEEQFELLYRLADKLGAAVMQDAVAKRGAPSKLEIYEAADVVAKRKANVRGAEYPSDVEDVFREAFPTVWRFIRHVNRDGWAS